MTPVIKVKPLLTLSQRAKLAMKNNLELRSEMRRLMAKAIAVHKQIGTASRTLPIARCG